MNTQSQATAPASSTTPLGDVIGETTEELKAAGRGLVQALVAQFAAKASEKIDQAVEQLDRVATESTSDAGPQVSGWIAAARAKMSGRNPVWAGIKGAWSGSSTTAKVLVVTTLVLLFVLAPVPSVLLLLTLLVVWIVRAIKRGTR